MTEFTITCRELWATMDRAEERVHDRLRTTTRVTEAARIPYAVVGDHAIRAWVAQVDEAAIRVTQDVDLLTCRADLPAMMAAKEDAGFHHGNTGGFDMFVERPDASARDAVHVLICGCMQREEDEPNPDVTPTVRAGDVLTQRMRRCTPAFSASRAVGRIDRSAATMTPC